MRPTALPAGCSCAAADATHRRVPTPSLSRLATRTCLSWPARRACAGRSRSASCGPKTIWGSTIARRAPGMAGTGICPRHGCGRVPGQALGQAVGRTAPQRLCPGRSTSPIRQSERNESACNPKPPDPGARRMAHEIAGSPSSHRAPPFDDYHPSGLRMDLVAMTTTSPTRRRHRPTKTTQRATVVLNHRPTDGVGVMEWILCLSF